MTFSTRVSSQTDFLIVSHVDRIGPRTVLIKTHVTTFFGDILRKIFFTEKAEKDNGIESINQSGLQRDN
jgi:hypothetical protein